MKILSTQQVREADAFTISHEPISPIDLMERAAKACAEWIFNKYGNAFRYLIVCGNGNNGGDGLAIARLLNDQGCFVEIYIVRVAEKDSENFSENLNRLKQLKSNVNFIENAAEIHFPIQEHFLFIDAVFGSGLSREPQGLAANVIDKMNSISAMKIAIDIPSGLFCDDNSENEYKHVVRAAYTLCFQQPKMAFMFSENSSFVGNLVLLNINLHQDYILQAKTSNYYITHDTAKSFLRNRPLFSHKGNFGHALLVVGSEGKMGAAVLCAQACLRSGVGLLSLNIPEVGNSILQIAVPEAMLQLNDSEKIISGRIKTGPKSETEFSAIGIGPGIGTEKETAQALKLLLNEFDGPIVLDADALNIISENKTWLAFLPKGTILTPHPGEFDRLTENHKTGFERLNSQRALALKHGIYIVLKGAHTSIACPDGSVFYNSSGNPGMATGGSGDVLTGIITGLRAQGYFPQAACILGVYLHGLSGDIAASVQSEHSLIASDIIEHLGGAWRMLQD